ncbi:MAG TPA: hypothetical protein VHJ58_03780, partial [Vicinamibacterales bacterium]|nr:hypothetical protein [Vicinamibacterales bacterium]
RMREPTPYSALVQRLRAVERERAALQAERRRLSERLEIAQAEVRAARDARDVALRVATWGLPRRDEA